MNDKKTVALLYGGMGCERDVSVLSREYVRTLVDPNRYSLIEIFIDRDGRWLIDNKTAVPAFDDGFIEVKGERHKIDVAIPLLHGDMGEDGVIQGALECMRVPYVGSRVHASAIASDKIYTKIIAEALGIPTVKYVECSNMSTQTARDLAEKQLGYPMFVKPARLGSSIGAMGVWNSHAFAEAYENASILGSGRVLIEEMMCDKRELECAYFCAGGRTVISSPAEISIDALYSYEDKYFNDRARLRESANVSTANKRLIKEYTLELVKKIGIRHLARCDFFLCSDKLYLNEINTMPGFTEKSMYPRLISNEGIAPIDMMTLFIEDAYACAF